MVRIFVDYCERLFLIQQLFIASTHGLDESDLLASADDETTGLLSSDERAASSPSILATVRLSATPISAGLVNISAGSANRCPSDAIAPDEAHDR